MGVLRGGEGLGGGGSVANEGVHSESSVYHCGVYQKSPDL